MDENEIEQLFESGSYDQIISIFSAGIPKTIDIDLLLTLVKSYARSGSFSSLMSRKSEILDLVEGREPIIKLGIYHFFLMAFYRLGQYHEGLDFLEQTKLIHDQIEYTRLNNSQKVTYASFYNHSGILHFALKKYNIALLHYNKLETYGIELSNNKVLESARVNIAVIYSYLGLFDKAIGMYERIIADALERGEEMETMIPLNNIASLYSDSGNLQKAGEVIDAAYNLATEAGDQLMISKVLTNRADLYRRLGKLEEAKEDLTRSYGMKQKQENDYECLTTLFSLIEVLVRNKERERAAQFLEMMKKHRDNVPDDYHEYDLAKAFYLKESALTRHQFQAEDILRNLRKHRLEEVDVHLKFLNLLWLMELLVRQVDETGEQELLTSSEKEKVESELIEIYQEIIELQEMINSPVNQLHIHYIRAYLHLFFLQPEKVMAELEKAKELLENTGIKTLELNQPDVEIMRYLDKLSPSLNQSLNSLIHGEPRLKIIIALLGNPKLTFRELQEITGLTTGNLGRHADKLAEAGYVDKRKEIVDDKFLIVFSITSLGISEFQAYQSILRPHIAT